MTETLLLFFAERFSNGGEMNGTTGPPVHSGGNKAEGTGIVTCFKSN